jgi:hypothetical protein
VTDFWLSPGLAGELWDHDGVGLEMSDRPKIRLNLHHCTIHNILIWKQKNKQTFTNKDGHFKLRSCSTCGKESRAEIPFWRGISYLQMASEKGKRKCPKI